MNFLAPLLIFLFSIAFQWEWVTHWESLSYANPDNDGSLLIWLVYWPLVNFQSYIQGTNFTSWNDSNIFYGLSQSYVLSERMFGYLPLLLFLEFFEKPVLWNTNLIQFFFQMLQAFGIFFWLKQKRLQTFPSLIASIATIFSSYFLKEAQHWQMQAFALTPWILYFLLKFSETKNLINLLIIILLWVWIANLSTHVFLFFTPILLFLLLSEILIVRRLSNFILFFLGLLLVLFSILPYLQSPYPIQRFRVETILFANSFGGFRDLTIVEGSIMITYLFSFRTKSRKQVISDLILVLILCLISILALGARPYYPYTIFYNVVPGFDRIRDVSRILILFWLVFPILFARSIEFYGLQMRIRFRLCFYALLFFINSYILYLNRSPLYNYFPESIRFESLVNQLKNKQLYPPLLLIGEDFSMIGHHKIDARMQYAIAKENFKLLGGYSGVNFPNLFLLRYAVNEVLRGESNWNKEQVYTLLKESGTNSLVRLTEKGEEVLNWKIWKSLDEKTIPDCPKKWSGVWRNIQKISQNYGLILGFSPKGKFCIGSYGKLLDQRLQLNWLQENRVVYSDTLFISTPFYYHPSAPEILTGVDGFRKKGKYKLQLLDKSQILFESTVSVE